MKMIGPLNSGAAVGGAGVATANADSAKVIEGFVVGVYVKYNGAKPGTTDVTIATKGASPEPPARSILALTNAVTDGWFYPSVQAQDTTGAALTGVYQDIPIFDYVNVKIDQGNAGDSVDVWLLLREGF
jgi:hypothetical protein